jgi:hypothetical protein
VASSPRLAMMRVEPVNLDSFRASLEKPTPPEGLSLAAQALWWDAKGDWDQAHRCAQEQDDAPGAWVHAYLHRKEGDAANAGYWYGRAGKPAATVTLDSEWTEIVRAVLKDAKPASGIEA